jgi:hypothetical protein
MSFPIHPQPGDTYRSWTWDGTAWVCTHDPSPPPPPGIDDAPKDGRMFVRKDGQWIQLPAGTGSITYVGDNAPDDPQVGELWFNTLTSELLVWDGDEWHDTGTGIAGPVGPAGPQGIPGPQGPPGKDGDAGQDGADGMTWPVHGVTDDSWAPAEMVGEAFQNDIGVASPVDLGNPPVPLELDLSPGNYTVWIDLQATTETAGQFLMYVEVDSQLRPENTLRMGPLTDVHCSTTLHVSSDADINVNVYATYPFSTSGWMGYCSIKARRMF